MTINIFLDANVLVPVSMTDILLRIGEAGLLDPHWSETVLGEARRALERHHTDVPEEAWDRRFAAMNRAFPEALTVITDEAIGALTLPDADDRHVVAGAILAKSTVIVTQNIKDFPNSVLESYGIRAVTPNALLLEFFSADLKQVMNVLEEAAAHTKNPPLTVEHILGSLAAAGAKSFAATAHQWMRSQDAASGSTRSQDLP